MKPRFPIVYGENGKRVKNPLSHVSVNCVHCGNGFAFKVSRKDPAKFCSNKCKLEYGREIVGSCSKCKEPIARTRKDGLCFPCHQNLYMTKNRKEAAERTRKYYRLQKELGITKTDEQKKRQAETRKRYKQRKREMAPLKSSDFKKVLVIKEIKIVPEWETFLKTAILDRPVSRSIVYGLIDPRTNELRYIGKSTSGIERPSQHLKPRIYNGSLRKTYLYNWVRSVVSAGFSPKIVVLEECEKKEMLIDREIWHIDHWKKLGCNLTNATIGGEGCLGRKWSEEQKRKFSESKCGKTLTEEHRKKLSISHIGLPSGRKGVKASEETRRRITESLRSRMHPIVCLETGQEFESCCAAARSFGVDKKIVYNNLKRGKSSDKSKLSVTFVLKESA